MVAIWFDLSPITHQPRRYVSPSVCNIPNTTPPFQTTKPAKAVIMPIYGHSWNTTNLKLKRAVIAMLYTQDINSGIYQFSLYVKYTGLNLPTIVD